MSCFPIKVKGHIMGHVESAQVPWQRRKDEEHVNGKGLWPVIFLAKYCQNNCLKVEYSIIISLILVKNHLKEVDFNFFLGRVSPHLCLLATILRDPWNNVASWVKLCLRMHATLAPSRNWKQEHCLWLLGLPLGFQTLQIPKLWQFWQGNSQKIKNISNNIVNVESD